MTQERPVTDSRAPVAIAQALLDAFSAADIDRMRQLLGDDLVAYITTASGDSIRVEGAGSYLDRVQAMDLKSADFALELTQPPVVVDTEHVLVMVKIRALRGSRTLENYAAHLLRVSNKQVVEWHMVDAKPAESEAFWSSTAGG
jgi:ketosteroid isomerase-like protein